MTTMTTKPSQPSSLEIANELGITAHVAGWKQLVAARRSESKLQADYEAAIAAFAQTEAGQADAAFAAERTADTEARNAKLTAAGCQHLIGAKITKSSRGTVAAVVGGRASALTDRECEAMGYKAGPGNN